jgi:hypothetical protein
MKIIINVGEEGNVTTDIQGAKAPDAYSFSKHGEGSVPITEVKEQIHDAGAAPKVFEESITALETRPLSGSDDINGDGGKAPSIVEMESMD